jgi:YD repeat-containing protein
MHRLLGLPIAALCAALGISSALADAPGSATYIYDDLGRVRSAQYDDGNIQSYTYDDAGNRILTTPDGVAVISIVANATIAEGNTVNLTVRRDGYLASALTLSVQATNGTALAGTNYTVPGPTVSFVSGQTTATVSVPTLRDNTYNVGVTFTVTVSCTDEVKVNVHQRSSLVTVTNVDPPPSFSISGNGTVAEGNTATYTITKTNATKLDHDVTVSIAPFGANQAIASTDYSLWNGASSQKVTFVAVDPTHSVSVTTIHVPSYSTTVTYRLTLSSPTNGAVLGTATKNTNITNTDSPPSFSIGNATSIEQSVMAFPVTMTGASRLVHTVAFSATSGTATVVSDFLAPLGSPLSFSANIAGNGTTTQTKTIYVTSLDDALTESNENFTVLLSAPSNSAIISTGTATGTIVENLTIPPEVPGPLVPNDIEISGGAGISVVWSQANGHVTRYELYKQEAADPSPSLLYQGMTMAYSGTIGPPGTYTLSLRACNAIGCGPYTYGTVLKDNGQ